MNCEWTQQHDIEFAEGLLSKVDVNAYRGHLVECDDCRNRQSEVAIAQERLTSLAAKLKAPSRKAEIESLARRSLNESSTISSRRRLPTLRWIGWAAAAAFIAWAVGLLPMPAKRYETAQSALGAVARRVQETQSVRMQISFRCPDATLLTGEIISTPERARIREADGKIGVGEFASGRGIVILEEQRKVIEWTEPLQIPNLYEAFRGLGDQLVEPRPEQLDGRTMWVFPARILTETATIWVDPQTLLPARIEYWKEKMWSPRGMVSGTVVISDILWDEPIDPSLLSLDPPPGYEVERLSAQGSIGVDASGTNPNPDLERAREDYMAGPLDTRMHNLVFGCLIYAQNNPADSASWPAEIERIRPYVHPGTLRNPNRPELEVGFAYIRPTGRPMWDSAENRRLVFHEIFAEWPGAAWVSYTDGAVERIEDRERFEALIAAARQASESVR